MKLDAFDKKICYYLTQNARLSLSTLSKHVGLSREAVNSRIKKLQNQRTILSFKTIFSHPYFGLKFFNFYINFVRLDSKKHKTFENYIRGHTSVIWTNKCLGKWDYALFLLIKDSNDLSGLIAEFKEKFRGFIKDFEFDEVLYEYNFRAFLPAFFQDVSPKPLKLKKEDSSFFNLLSTKTAMVKKGLENTVKLDKTDVQIMEQLSENCRASLEEMGRKLKILPENARYRIKKLIEKNAICAFWASINYDAFGLYWYRIKLRANKISEEDEKKLRGYFLNHPNILWATRTLGKTDIHIDIRVKGNNELNDFLADLNTRFEGLIIDYETIIMTQEQDYNNFTKKFYEIAE